MAEKMYYTMGEVAGMFQVNPSLIRFWEKEFDLIKPYRNKKGNRLFTAQDVACFEQIYHLVKERGFTLHGAKEQLKARPLQEDESRQRIAENLRRIRKLLLELREQC